MAENIFAVLDLGLALAGLSGELEARDVRPLVAALVERMKAENDGNIVVGLGLALGGLGGSLEDKDVQSLATALAERMKVEKNGFALAGLGLSLARLSRKLEAKDLQSHITAFAWRWHSVEEIVTLLNLGRLRAALSGEFTAQYVRPGAVALEEAMRTRNDFEAVPVMAAAWVTLERIAYGKLDHRKRVQAYVDLLRLPLVVGDARKALLDGLDKLTGERFEGDLWRFVGWATRSDEGKALRLDLVGP